MSSEDHTGHDHPSEGGDHAGHDHATPKGGGGDHAGHSHGPSIGSAGLQHRKPLAIAFGLTFTFLVVEVIGGLIANSLALLSDAAHMATDTLGLGLALAAIQLASRPRAGQRTYGTYRLEVLAAVINGLLLFGVGGYVLYEAVRRFSDPPEVLGLPMLLVATVGLIVNLISFRLLSAGSKESLNVQGASLEVLADLIGSVGVIFASIIISTTGFSYADPITAGVIGLFVLPRTYKLMKQAVRILMEVAPPGIDVDAAEARLAQLPGVAAVHDLHIWTVTSGIESATAHVVVREEADWHDVLDQTRQVLAKEYGVTHATIQVEPHDHVEEPAAV